MAPKKRVWLPYRRYCALEHRQVGLEAVLRVDDRVEIAPAEPRVLLAAACMNAAKHAAVRGSLGIDIL